VRRAGEAAALLSGAGLVTLVGMISPYRADRDRVRARHAACGVAFLEVFVDAPLAVAESRDPKGLYVRARAGEIRGFTGIDDPYEAPAAPEVRLPTGERGAEDCAQLLVDAIVSAARRE
jgi:bifunctional enzyme CysN/CysC